MKTLIFSDLHLTDKFESKKYQFLKKIISESDKVIINGDFWDSYLTTFNRFVKSPWKKLFPLLKSKDTVYIFGNHDKRVFANQDMRLFSSLQTDNYLLTINRKKYLIQHGNKIYPALDDLLGLQKPPFWLIKFVNFGYKYLFKKFGKSFLKVAFSGSNRKIKKKIDNFVREKEILICGHTHYAEIDLDNRYANSGIFHFGLAQYLIIDSKGEIGLYEEWYDR